MRQGEWPLRNSRKNSSCPLSSSHSTHSFKICNFPSVETLGFPEQWENAGVNGPADSPSLPSADGPPSFACAHPFPAHLGPGCISPAFPTLPRAHIIPWFCSWPVATSQCSSCFFPKSSNSVFTEMDSLPMPAARDSVALWWLSAAHVGPKKVSPLFLAAFGPSWNKVIILIVLLPSQPLGFSSTLLPDFWHPLLDYSLPRGLSFSSTPLEGVHLTRYINILQ